jgi:hypothetical protein
MFGRSAPADRGPGGFLSIRVWEFTDLRVFHAVAVASTGTPIRVEHVATTHQQGRHPTTTSTSSGRRIGRRRSSNAAFGTSPSSVFANPFGKDKVDLFAPLVVHSRDRGGGANRKIVPAPGPWARSCRTFRVPPTWRSRCVLAWHTPGRCRARRHPAPNTRRRSSNAALRHFVEQNR